MGLSATMCGFFPSIVIIPLDYSLRIIMPFRKTEISSYRPSRNGSFTFQRRRYEKPSSAEWDSDHNFCIACIQPSNEGPLNLTLLPNGYDQDISRLRALVHFSSVQSPVSESKCNFQCRTKVAYYNFILLCGCVHHQQAATNCCIFPGFLPPRFRVGGASAAAIRKVFI